MKELTVEQKILLLETKIKSLEDTLFILAESHFGDSEEFLKFTNNYKTKLILNYPESCK